MYFAVALTGFVRDWNWSEKGKKRLLLSYLKKEASLIALSKDENMKFEQ